MGKNNHKWNDNLHNKTYIELKMKNITDFLWVIREQLT